MAIMFLPRGCSPFYNVQSRHHGRGDSVHRGALTPGNDLIDGLCPPGNSTCLRIQSTTSPAVNDVIAASAFAR